MSTDVAIHDERAFNEGMASVRSDQADVNWMLCGHWDNNPNEIAFMESGSGGPDEFASHMDDSQNLYGLLRLEEEFDMSTTIKFVYVHWDGKDVSFVKRGKFGVVQGAIEGLFSPYHMSLINVDTRDELTREYIMSKLQDQSGTKSKVLEAEDVKNRPERGFTSGTTTKADSTGATPTKASKMTNIGRLGSSFAGVSRGSAAGVKIEDDVYQALDDIRNDSAEANWCAAGYTDNNPKNPLVLLGSGVGTTDEIRQFCADDNAIYGLFRVTDVVDDIPTVKFAYIQWLGENMKPMAKAKVSTYKGALEEVFKPFHVTIFATATSEISQRVVMDKVMSASGSKSNVK